MVIIEIIMMVWRSSIDLRTKLVTQHQRMEGKQTEPIGKPNVVKESVDT